MENMLSYLFPRVHFGTFGKTITFLIKKKDLYLIKKLK